MPFTAELTDYYARRAQEYDRIYAKPERQADLAKLRAHVPELLSGRHVYEAACGTGYWTQFVARRAASIFAFDYNEEVLAIARERAYSPAITTFVRGDAFAPPEPPRACDGGLAAFWWSHLKLEGELESFLAAFFARLQPGARFVFLDNRYIKGSSTPIARTDAAGNTYQRRQLVNGEEHEVLKNFPDESEVSHFLAPHASTIAWQQLEYYWCAWGERHA